MNIITLNTEENEIHQLQYTNTERFATKSESEFDQHADNIDEQGESHKNDRDEGYLGVELPALKTQRGKHKRGRSLLDRMKDSFFGNNAQRDNASRHYENRLESLGDREYQKIDTITDRAHFDNQIPFPTTTREGKTDQEMLPTTPEEGIKAKIQRRILSRGTENEINTGNISFQSSKFTNISLNKSCSTSPNMPTASRNWKKLQALKVALKFTDQANVLVDARVGMIMKGVTSDGAEKKSNKYFIDPNSRSKFAWDFLISFAICYYIFILPCRFAFALYGRHWNFIDLGFDILFTLDILLKFFIGVNNNEEILFDRKEIVLAYLKRQFIIDLTCLLPLYFVNEYLAAIKLLRMFQLRRFAKVTDEIFATVLSFLLQGRINITLYEMVRTCYKTLFLLIGLSHILNCFWISIGFFSKETFETAGLDEYNYREHTKFDTYIEGMYFMVTTVTTVGFGDSSPSSQLGMIYAMFAQFAGIGLMAYFQSNVTYFAKKLDSKKDKLTKKEEELENWIYKKEIAMGKSLDTKFCRKLKSYFRYLWLNDIKSLLCDQRYFFELSPAIQHQIGDLLFGEIMKNFNYFFNFFEEEECKLNFLKYLRPIAFVEGQQIIKRGTKSKGLFFILAGNVEVCDENDIPSVILPSHSYFGDHFLFNRNSQHNYIAASDIVQCLYIHKDHLISLLEFYPKTRENLEKVALTRHRHLHRTKMETIHWSRGRTMLPLSKNKLKEAPAEEINPINEAQSYQRSSIQT